MEVEQILRKCQVQDHQSQNWMGICLGKNCDKNNRLGCMKCMKKYHKDCSINEIIDLNDINEKEFKFFPKWIQQIQDFCDLKVVNQILEEELMNQIDEKFDLYKETIIEQIAITQQKIKKQFKEKSDLYKQTRFITEEYQKFNLNNQIQEIFIDKNQKWEQLQDRIQQFAEFYQQSKDQEKLGSKELEFFKEFKKSQMEIQNIQEFLKDFESKLNNIKQTFSTQMQQISFQHFSETIGLDCLERSEHNMIYDQLKQHFKEYFYFKKIFDTEDDGFQTNNFHQKCDLKKNVLIIIETKDQDRFGGFTSLSFDKNSDNSSEEGGFNFLFNLNTKKIFTQNNLKKSIQNNQTKGPIFGQNDIWIYNNANSSNDSNTTLGEAYGQNEGASSRDLTKSYNFYIQRYYVFQLQF